MRKIKQALLDYPHWGALNIYIEKIELNLEADFSHALENAKALLEAIGKEICSKRGKELDKAPDVGKVVRTAFVALGHEEKTLVPQIAKALSTIGQNLGNLRNDIGTTAHGKTVEEIETRNDKVNWFTRDFLMETVDSIAFMLIMNYEAVQMTSKILQERKPSFKDYTEETTFNEAWDSSFGAFDMGEYSYTASEILYHLDPQAYQTEYHLFKETEEEE